MNLPHISVKRPVATMMVFIAILLFGVISLKKLPLDIMPEVEYPSLTVITVFPGASADEVEQQVTKTLEAVLSGSENLNKIKSSSRENVSFISMQFNWGSDVTRAANNTRDLLELVKSRLPQDARAPIIYKVNSSMMPVMVYSVTALENYNGLGQIIEDDIAAPLRKVEGVGTVIYLGQPEREIQINVDPDKLNAYHLSIAMVSTVLKAENISIPGGNIKTGSQDFAVRIPGDIAEVNDLNKIAITSFMGRVIRLEDIATVKDAFMETDEFARDEFSKGAAIMVQKQSGQNSLDVVEAVRAKIAEVEASLPEDVKLNEVMSQEEVIKESISNLTSTIWFALIFVVLVVFAFLREWKSSFIVLLTIPVALIVGLIVMYVFGWTINIFSLLSLVIAIGMVVDNAIVVLENITQHIEKGEPPREAAIFGTSEMGTAISASTLTTLMVFLPLIFVGGIVGILFKQLAILTAACMLASLVTALTLTPMIASKMLKGKDKKNEKKKSRFYEMSERSLQAFENSYKRLLNWTVGHKFITIFLSVALLAFSLYEGMNMGTDFIPNFDAGDVAVVFQTEVGTSAEETDRVAQKIIKVMNEKVPEKVPGTLVAISGQTQDGALTTVGFAEGKNVGTVMCHLTLPNKRERTAAEIGEVLRSSIEEIPEVEKYHVTAGNILSSALLGNSKPIEINFSGKDLDQLNVISSDLKKRMEETGKFIDLVSTADNGKVEYLIQIDRDRASSVGLNTAMIALQVRQAVYGTDGGEISEKGDDYDINIRYPKEKRSDINSLKDISLSTLTGNQVHLGDVADIVLGTGPLEIQRESQQRIVSVKSDITGISLGEGKEVVEKILAEMEIPSNVDMVLSGQINSQKDSFSDLYAVLVIGILLVYMVMAAQFESFKHPFIIMLAVPFMLIGVVWAFKLTGLTLSVTTFIGIIMLLGIVVNNGIVLVDYTNLLRKRGYSVNEAVKEAGRSRIRPVLMTSFTTILAMVPMALSKGMGKEMFSPMGITIIGGLLISTIVTLVIVPVLYATFNKHE